MQKALHIEEAFHLPMGGKSAGVPCAGRKLYLRRSEPMHRHVREDKRGFIKKGTFKSAFSLGGGFKAHLTHEH